MIVCYETYFNVFYYVIVENTYHFLLTCKSQCAIFYSSHLLVLALFAAALYLLCSFSSQEIA